MKNLSLLTFLLFAFQASFGQDMPVVQLPSEVFKVIKKQTDPIDSLKWKWKRAGTINLNIAQGSLSNWAAGGDNFSLAINNYFNYFVYYRKDKHIWDNNVDFYFGLIQTTSLGTRKNDDRIDILSKYGYNFDGKWYVTGLFNFRSQFFDGYTFSGDQSTFASTTLSPAYFILSAGLDYKPNQNLSVFLSPLTSRSVLVLNETLSQKGAYGVSPGKKMAYEIGFFSSTNYNKDLGKTVAYKGKLDLFSNYAHNPENIDLFMTNMISFKINKYLAVTYNLDMIYDDDVKLFKENSDSPALQLKSQLGIGFVKKLNPVITFAPVAVP